MTPAPVAPVVAAVEPARPLLDGDGKATVTEAKVLPRVEIMKPAAAGRARAPEPIIHVSIGRIEVRAAAAPGTAQKARAASPVMSLGEYLERRRKRGSA